MKKSTLFLILTVMWVLNAGIGGWFLYGDIAAGGSVFSDPKALAHTLYMAAALAAAILTFMQYLKHRKKTL